MGKEETGKETWIHDRLQLVSDMGDVALMEASLGGLTTDELRTLCRRRHDIAGEQIAKKIRGRKKNVRKHGLV